jgi:hypothetical protein
MNGSFPDRDLLGANTILLSSSFYLGYHEPTPAKFSLKTPEAEVDGFYRDL